LWRKASSFEKNPITVGNSSTLYCSNDESKARQPTLAAARTGLKDYFLSRLTTWLWSGIVIFFVTLAAYTSLGRMITSNAGQYREDILRELNARLSFAVEVDELRGSWESFTPRFELEGVRLLGDSHAAVSMELSSVYLELDVLGSILSRAPRLYVLAVSGARLHVDIDADGQLSLPGLPVTGGGNLGNPLYQFVTNAERLELNDIQLDMDDGSVVRKNLVAANLQREGDFRRFKLSLLSPDRKAWFRTIAEGTGDLSDFAAFKGLFHLETSMEDVGAYRDFLARMGIVALEGGLRAELWLTLDDGRAEVAAKLEAEQVRAGAVAEPEKIYDLQHLAGALRADYELGIWHFAVSDLDFRGYERDLKLDYISGEYAGNSAIFRVVDLDLGSAADYLVESPILSDTLSTLIADLRPRGRAKILQLELPDLENLGSWALTAEVEGLGVDSWKSAPGVENASGYLAINPRDGLLQLDSSEFSMFFPVLFDDALTYHDFGAELAWRIDEDAFRLRSGPFTGLGEEGEVRGLFSLAVPLEKTDIGIEMDLLVGLSDTRARHRAKYLPRTLAANLLNWLDVSIGEGNIREGGFIWRGSLRNRDHRTMQSFFDLEDTAIEYHPQWPALSEVDALIMIDDLDVDVFSPSARILDSWVRDIEVNIRSNEDRQLLLSVSAAMSGPAADGLTAIHGSPLRNIVGDAFVDWTLTGPLQTRLQLQMNLTDTSLPPRVAVDTDWQSVDVDMGTLNLQLRDLDGHLSYRSATGFSAADLSASLWGQNLSADISQDHSEDGLGVLDIAISGRVEVDSVRDWLDLDMLRLAQGASLVKGHILVPPGESPRLEINSELEGVSLDLPAPWGKLTDESRRVSLQYPLGKLPRRMMLNMEQEIFLGVLFGEQGYAGGSLGFSRPLAAEEPGRFLVGGDVDALDWEIGTAFLDKYVFDGREQQPGAAILVGVRDLQIGEARLFGQTFKDLHLDVEQRVDSWQLLVELDWLKGSLVLPDDLSSATVNLESLDFEGLTQNLGNEISGFSPSEISLPPIDVNIAGLQNGEDAWGDLSFKFFDEQGQYRFRDIRGDLRGFQLGDEEGMQLAWSGQSGTQETRLNGTLLFKDFAAVLASYSYDQIIETETGRVDLDVHWPGAPWDYSLATTDGGVNVDVGAGRFLKTTGGAEGTLRVVNILNLAEFVRRLSLDLSYMFESGIPFDSIKGNLDLQSGIIEVPAMAVVGPSTRFQFSGTADVPDETIDGELVATLPIASNLPWIAALISGLPAAAAVYVISKLFTKQMDRFSSASYHVEGPWNDPTVNFESIFDDPTAKPAIRAPAPEEIKEDAASSEEPVAG
jgi:uncharacterized protein (TIGR02099 family)